MNDLRVLEATENVREWELSSGLSPLDLKAFHTKPLAGSADSGGRVVLSKSLVLYVERY